MTQRFRIGGGLVDRSKTLRFKFNGMSLEGHTGDTLASALLANGRRLVGRSFKYHRPRGIFSAGPEEPNALVTLRSGSSAEPNTRATTAELFDGLAASSQNHRLSLNFDLMAVGDFLSPFLSAGFYYKTFMWPKSFWEKVYEPAIRASAGLGALSGEPDPDIYDKGFIHCDILVVGAGAAGLAAALTAGKSGASVVLADEDFQIGGRLNAETHTINGKSGTAWARDAVGELEAMENVRIMPRTTVYGSFDHGVFGAIERCTDHLPSSNGRPRQILWRIYSKRSVLCSGATERPIAFPGNDRPGIMLAASVRTYANRYGVIPGKRVTVFTCCDDGWRTASDLIDKGVRVTAVLDTRDNVNFPQVPGARVELAERVVATRGRTGLAGIKLQRGDWIETDCLAVSGGWNPNVHLSCHQRGRPRWRDDIAAFVPGGSIPEGMKIAGAASGALTLSDAIGQGRSAAAEFASDLGYRTEAESKINASDEKTGISAFWSVSGAPGRAWVDFQNDVTVKDIAVAAREGYRSSEMLKRYTTAGMATDQGKTANVLALALLAEQTGKSVAEEGTTIYRPPYTAIPIGALAGRSRDKDFRPIRYTPSHRWAESQGAVFVETGNWLRAQWYPRRGEAHWRQSVDREVSETRRSVGICDVSTLGKIEIFGRDVGEFLDRVYANTFNTLAVGKIRYGLMLREDGIVYDDGTTARLGKRHFVMTTTTANAALVYRNLEFARQCLWPDLDVHLISATDGWAQYSVAGPNSRDLLRKVVEPSFDLSKENFPFMACAETTVFGGVPSRLFRISFSGELAYEIAVPAKYGRSMMERLMSVGEEFEATPYGTEALGVMRVEKGHFAGNELDGRTTALNLGLGRMVSKKKDCIGNVLSERPELNRSDAVKLSGFKPVNRSGMLTAGAHFLSPGQDETMGNDQGWMSSVAYSPTLGHSIGLGFIARGDERRGETVRAVDLVRGKDVDVEIVSPHFYDPEGVRQRG
ncbi:MAG: sarcosine oxidase subunit alpha family protein [Albidovulum sp.]|nr:sarcosine oxidase subunit alpha family protein [Albidovulum sp.]